MTKTTTLFCSIFIELTLFISEPTGSIDYLIPKPGKRLEPQYVVGITNSKLTNFWFEYKYSSTKVSGNYFDLNGNQIKSITLPKSI